MLLALLIPVPGLLGGPVPMLPLDTLRLIALEAAGPGGAEAGGAGASKEAEGTRGGVFRRGADVGPASGPGPLTVRGGAADRGGGGVAVGVGVFSAPAFLLTQRLRLGS
jgi:hypothetical protein